MLKKIMKYVLPVFLLGMFYSINVGATGTMNVEKLSEDSSNSQIGRAHV